MPTVYANDLALEYEFDNEPEYNLDSISAFDTAS